MSTIRKHYRKWQCLVRVKDHPQIIKSFKLREDAKRWGIETELKIRREDTRINKIKYPTFNEIGLRYISDVSITKKGFVNERNIIKALFSEAWSLIFVISLLLILSDLFEKIIFVILTYTLCQLYKYLSTLLGFQSKSERTQIKFSP